MDKRIIDLWADIGSEDYWDDLPVYKYNRPVPFEEIYIPFGDRWPQPGFIGKRYFKLPKHKRVVVIGQNPSTPKEKWERKDDKVMLNQIKRHSREQSSESLKSLFSVMRKFMRGTRTRRNPWGPIRDMCMRDYIGLKLADIAYLNLIPLEMQGEDFDLKTLREPYEISTRLQIQLLKPHKILFYGKMPHDNFKDWEDEVDDWDICYVERIRGNIKVDYDRFAKVKKWLKS